MTQEERLAIRGFLDRVADAEGASAPVDPEVDGLVAQAIDRRPEIRYRLAQLALIQEIALGMARDRIHRLTWERDAALRERDAGRRMLGLLPARVVHPAPPVPEVFAPAAVARGGNGFLGGALPTAASVAALSAMGAFLAEILQADPQGAEVDILLGIVDAPAGEARAEAPLQA